MGTRRWNRALVSDLVDGGYTVLSRVGQLAPQASPSHHGLDFIEDVPYRTGGDPFHRLDIYRPENHTGSLPVVLYIHGGGFRACSKRTHWLMGLGFARAGFLVFSINYRLAPLHPFPAAIEDVCEAWRWVVASAEKYGGDPERIVLAGESAGANLAAALVLCTCYERPEPWARAAFEVGVVPRAAIPACGLLQVSDSERFRQNGRLGRLSAWVIGDTEDCYLGDRGHGPATALADPLLLVEAAEVPQRAIPPFFLPVGGWDPLSVDSSRLADALERMGVEAEARIYPREVHAFHAFVWRPRARQCWRDMIKFAKRCTEPG